MPQQSQFRNAYGYGGPQDQAYGNHAAFGGFMNDSTAQMGFQVGKTAINAGQDYVEQNVSNHTTMPLLIACD